MDFFVNPIAVATRALIETKNIKDDTNHYYEVMAAHGYNLTNVGGKGWYNDADISF